MIKNHKIYHRSAILFVLLFGLMFISAFSVRATEVDRVSLCDLEGLPGDAIDTKITLTGTDLEERTGFWYTHYKEVEGDDSKMDITSWITIEPKDYSVKEGESMVFTIKVAIPKDAGPGLWGATSVEAGKPGHSYERRTYLIFKDAITGGNVYSGLLLPVAINVLPSPNPLTPLINFVKKNIMTTALCIVIIALLAMLMLKRKGEKQISSKEKPVSSRRKPVNKEKPEKLRE